MKKTPAILPVLILLVSAGCAAPEVREITYYVLEFQQYPGMEIPRRAEPVSAAVLIEDTEVSELYNGKEIVERINGPVVKYRNYDQWGIRLSVMISEALKDGMGETGIFREIRRRHVRQEAAYEILPRVSRLELIKGETENRVRFSLRLAFTVSASGEEAAVFEADFNEKLDDTSVTAFAVKANEMLNDSIEEFLLLIDEYFGTPE